MNPNPYNPNPYAVVRQFEQALCEYTGAPYAVTTTSCTMALLLAVAWRLQTGPKPGWRLRAEDWPQMRFEVEIPRRTYVGVPMSIIHAGGRPSFRDEPWTGMYELRPLNIWDSARWLTSAMYSRVGAGHMICLSFHTSKTLGDTQGGAILHDDAEADRCLRRMRFDGRTEGIVPKDDDFREIGYHCYMSADVAARLLHRLSMLPRHNEPLAWGPGTDSDYPDLSQLGIFR